MFHITNLHSQPYALRNTGTRTFTFWETCMERSPLTPNFKIPCYLCYLYIFIYINIYNTSTYNGTHFGTQMEL